MNLYGFRFSGLGLPVTFPALPRTKHFRWQRLYGVQIGSWFVGAVKGGPGQEWSAAQGIEAPSGVEASDSTRESPTDAVGCALNPSPSHEEKDSSHE